MPSGELLEDRMLLAADFGFAVEIGSSNDSRGDLVAVDGEGNVYNAGRFTGTAQVSNAAGVADAPPVTFTSAGGYDVLVTKYSSDGTLVWARQLASSADDGAPAGLAVDSSGNVYVAGGFTGTLTAGNVSLNSNGGSDAFVLKFDAAGQPIWGESFGAVGDDKATALAVDGRGNLVLGGTFTGTVNFSTDGSLHAASSIVNSSSAFLLSLSSLGNYNWVKTLAGGANPIVIKDAEFDLSGNVFVGGTFAGAPDFDPGTGNTTITSNGLTDVFLARFDAGGNFNWAKGFGNSMADGFAGLVVQASGSVIITGNVVANPNSPSTSSVKFVNSAGAVTNVVPAGTSATNAYVAEFDNLGAFQRVASFGGTQITEATGVALDAMGNVYVTGNYTGTADFDPQGLTKLQTSSGSTDIFLVKLQAATYDLSWASSIGGAGPDASASIAVDSSANILMASTIAGTADLDPTEVVQNFTTSGSRGSFLVKATQQSVGIGDTPIDDFGINGRAVTDVSVKVPSNDIAQSAVMQGTKIVVVGSSYTLDHLSNTVVATTVLSRYSANGQLDTTFGGGDGIVAVDMNQLGGILLQADNRIIVYGTNYGVVTVVRLTVDGAPDLSFGNGGKAVLPYASGSIQYASTIFTGVIQSDQKIVLGGSNEYSGGSLLILRLTKDGQWDSGFGYAGSWFYRAGNSSQADTVLTMAMQGNSIVFGGSVGRTDYVYPLGSISYSYGFVGRLTGNGTADATFSSATGLVVARGADNLSPFVSDQVSSLVVEANGAITFGGASTYKAPFGSAPGFTTGFIGQISSNGSINANYGDHGRLTLEDAVQAIARNPLGGITAQVTYVESYLSSDPNQSGYVQRSAYAVAHVLANGKLDKSYGNLGYASTIASGKPVVQADGFVVVPGTYNYDFLVTRLGAKGLPDKSFNKTGSVVTPMEQLASTENFAWTVAYDQHGRILVAGEVGLIGVSDSRAAIVRYLADGQLDATFGDGGIAYLSGKGTVYSVVALSNDSILVAGSSKNGAYLVKLKSDGSLDNLFVATDGTLFGYQGVAFSDLQIDSQGRIVATGVVAKDGHYGLVVARFKSNGQLDKTFSSDGFDVQFTAGIDQYGNSIAVTSTDKVVIGGVKYNGSTLKNDFAVWQYDTGGALDKSFNGNGIAFADFKGDDYATEVAVAPGGLIVVAGTTTSGGDGNDIAIAVFQANGKPYTSFDGDGKATYSTGLADNIGGMAVSGDGKIIVGGWTSQGFEVGRYLLNGRPDVTFSPQGVVVYPMQDTPTAFGAVAVNSDGRILVAGTTNKNINNVKSDFNFEILQLTGRNDPLGITLSNATVNENSAIGTLVGTIGVDAVNSGFDYTFTLTNNAGGRFRLNGDRLEVANSVLLNFETGAEYLVKIKTTDSSGVVREATFRIRIRDVNETPSSVFLSPNSVAEQSPVGTFVGRLTGIDPDFGAAFSFEFVSGTGSDDNGSFTLDQDGILRTDEVFNYLTRNLYSIRVRATDAGGLSVEQMLVVHISDTIPPIIISTTATEGDGKVYEGITSLGIEFSEAVSQADQAASFSLRATGADGLLGTADDDVVALTAGYTAGKTTLSFASLSAGIYRLTVKDTIRDTWNHQLDGDGDGVDGTDYRQDFVVLSRGTTTLSALGSVTNVGGDTPISTVAGDFNADGLRDLAVVSAAGNSVSVLLGDGAGGFALAGAPIATGGNLASSLVVGRFNGDLYDDLAVANSNSGTVSVLLGDGNGGFLLGSNITVAGGLAALASGRFNGDNKVDLAAVTQGGNLYVLLGNGAGGFSQFGSAINTGATGSRSIAAGLIDGDANLDLAIAQSTSNTISILRGTGDGGFALVGAPISSGGINPFSLALGAIDGDGKSDLAVVNAGSNTVSVLLGDGVGGFTMAGTPIAVGTFPISVAIRDLDLDHFADLIVANYIGNSVSVLLGNGNGTFSAAGSAVDMPGNPRSVVVDDFDATRPGLEAASVQYGSHDVRLVGVNGTPAALELNRSQSQFTVATTGVGAGQLVQSSGNAADGLNRLRVDGVDYATTGTPTLTDDGRTITTSTTSLSGLQVSREVTVPSDGSIDFVRTIDQFTNSTGAPISVTLEYLGNVGSDAATSVFATSSGDTTVTRADTWLGTDDADGVGAPAVIFYVHGRAGLTPTAVSTSGDNVRWSYAVTVQRGETLRLATFTILADTRALAVAAAEQLVSPIRLGADARTYLTAEEEADLANFILNFAPTDVTLGGGSVNENQSVGTAVGQLNTVDPDPQNTFTYSMVSGGGDTDNGRFTIDASGTIRTNQLFDFEDQSQRTIRVRSTDQGGLWTEKSFTITINDVYEPPVDVESNDTRETAINLAAGSTAYGFIGNGAAGAQDVDMYRVTLGAHQLASFNGYGLGGYNSGNFTTLHLYDESGNDLSSYLTYWGGYYSETGGTFYAAVTGPVSAYTFSYGAQTLTSITEAESNDTIATAQAVSVAVGSTTTRQGFWGDRTAAGDPDVYAVFVPADTVLEVSILSVPGFPTSGSSHLEALDAAGNVLAVNQAYYLPLRFYSSAGETIYVRFSERADLKQAYSIAFSLAATGANTDAPAISPIADQIIDEDTPSAPITFSISDPNASPDDITVTVTTSNETVVPQNRLLLSRSDGEWTLIATPAPDQNGLAVITVTATDILGRSSSNRFVLNVRPVNDAPVGVDLTSVALTENVPGAVVGVLSAEDPDNATTTGGPTFNPGRLVTVLTANAGLGVAESYELLFDPTDMFEIVGNQLKLKTGVAADFEELSDTLLIVRVTDSDGLTAEQDFTITVNNGNDAPSFTKGSDLTVRNNGGPQTIAGWATNISAGPADENGQALDFLVTNDNGGLFAAGGAPIVAANGTLSFTPAVGAVGTSIVTVRLHDGGGGTDTSDPQTFTISVANRFLAITKQPPTSIAAGAAFGLTITVLNTTDGKVLSNYNGPVTISLGANPGGATLGVLGTGTLTVTAKNGVATFTNLMLNKASVGYSLQVSAAGLPTTTTNAVNVVPAAPSQMTILSQPPALVTAGTSFGLSAQVFDRFGNLATNYSGNLSVSIAVNPVGGRLSGPTSVRVVNGVAQFNGLSFDKSAADYQLQVRGVGSTALRTDALAVQATTAAKLVFTTQPPTNVTAGVDFPVVARALDRFNNLATGFNGEVQASFYRNPGLSVLGGTTRIMAVNGVVTMTGLSLNKAANGYQLQLTSAGLPAIVTGGVNVRPAAASQLIVTTQPPASVVAGATFKVVVTARDAYGNTATGFTGNLAVVTTALGSNPGGATLGGTLIMKAGNGTATFGNLLLNKVGIGYTLQVTAAGLPVVVTNPLNVTAAAASQFLLTSPPPSTVAAGVPFAFSVQVADRFGNFVTNFAKNALVALAAAPAGGALGGAPAAGVPLVGGAATFTNLSLSKVGVGYKLRVTASGLPTFTTSAINVF